MVLSYGYCGWQNQQWHQHVPPSLAVFMAMAVCQCDMKHIAQCNMSRVTPEATGCRHRATTCSVLPQRLPRQQANKQQSTNTPKKLAVSMGMAMRRYAPARIAQWRRSRALLEATGRRHWASIAANRSHWTCICQFFMSFLIVDS